MKKIIIILSIFILLISFSTSEINAGELSLGIEKWSGHTTYKISGTTQNGDWKSILEFPLNTEFLKINYTDDIEVLAMLKSYTISYKRNIFKDSGTFKDSDWLYDINQKLIYAETKTRLTADIFNFEVKGLTNQIVNRVNLSGLMGYKHQEFNFIAGDGWQKSYLTDPPTTQEIDGDAIEYDITYMMPYMGLAVFNNHNKEINYIIKGSFIPRFWARDHDYHILRDKHAYTYVNGMGFNFSTYIQYKINNDWDIKGEYEYLKASGKGSQRQVFNDGTEYENIAAEIYTLKHIVDFGFSYSF